MRLSNKANYLGYSLLELLIIIFVIGILAVLASTSLKTLASRTRDTHRLNDIRALQQALKIYHAQYHDYPDTHNFQPGHNLTVNNQHLIRFPNNPWGGNNNCNQHSDYLYTRLNSSAYTIKYCLENYNNESSIKAGPCQATAQSLCE